MKFTVSNNQAALEISRDEALMLNNALAAVCDGPYAIEDWEFHPLIGANKDEAKTVLRQLGKVMDELKASSSD